MFEYGISAKWLELLKEISPGLKRAAVLRARTRSRSLKTSRGDRQCATMKMILIANDVPLASSARRATPSGG